MMSHRPVGLCLPSLGLLVSLLFAAPSGAADRPKVIATTVQITALATAVAGDLIELKGSSRPGRIPTSTSRKPVTSWRSRERR